MASYQRINIKMFRNIVLLVTLLIFDSVLLVSSSNNKANTERNAETIIANNHGESSTEPASALRSQSHSQQYLMLSAEQPGHFTPLMNREVAPGHVTMIGYTTPIVKVGDPIPLEQYLKEQQQQQEQRQTSTYTLPAPTSSSTDQQIAKIIERLTEGIKSTSGDSAHTSTTLDLPMSLFVQQQEQTAQTQAQQQPRSTLIQVREPAPAVKSMDHDQTKLLNTPAVTQFSFENEFNNNRQEFGSFSTPGKFDLDQSKQLTLLPLTTPEQQSEGQFAAPMEKPRPFVVFKPGYAPKSEQQQHLQQQFSQELAQPKLVQQAQMIQHQQPETKLIQTNDQFFSLKPNQQQQTNPLGSITTVQPLAPVKPLIPVQPLHHFSTFNDADKFEWTPAKPLSAFVESSFDQAQPAAFKQGTSSHQAVTPMTNTIGSMGLAQSSFLKSNLVNAKQPQVSSVVTTINSEPTVLLSGNSGSSPSSSIDTKAELQNQIKHILATSPNLSEDSRVRHRDAIMKAVVVGDSRSSHHAATITETGEMEPKPQGDMFNRFPGFPQFHPKSILFKYPIVEEKPTSSPVLARFQQATPNAHHHFSMSNIPSLLPGFQTSHVLNQQAQPALQLTEPAKPAHVPQLLSPTVEPKYPSLFQQHQSVQQAHPTLPGFFTPLKTESNRPASTPFINIDDNYPVLNTPSKIVPPSNKISLGPGLLLSSDETGPSSSSVGQSQAQAAEQENKHFFVSNNQQSEPTHQQFALSGLKTSTSEPSSSSHPSTSQIFSQYRPEASVSPKTTMRANSEWWKERALAESRYETISLLTNLPA